MDKPDETKMYCPSCKSSNSGRDDEGYIVCLVCRLQLRDINFKEAGDSENLELNSGRRTRLVSADRGPIMKQKSMNPVTYEECVQLILMHQVDALVEKFHFPKALSMAVGTVWLRYLELGMQEILHWKINGGDPPANPRFEFIEDDIEQGLPDIVENEEDDSGAEEDGSETEEEGSDEEGPESPRPQLSLDSKLDDDEDLFTPPKPKRQKTHETASPPPGPSKAASGAAAPVVFEDEIIIDEAPSLWEETVSQFMASNPPRTPVVTNTQADEVEASAPKTPLYNELGELIPRRLDSYTADEVEELTAERKARLGNTALGSLKISKSAVASLQKKEGRSRKRNRQETYQGSDDGWSLHRPKGSVVPRTLPRRMPTIHLTLCIIYLACATLRLPVLIADIMRWAMRGELPYSTAYKSLPPGLRLIYLLQPNYIPSTRAFSKQVRFLGKRLKLPLPPLNVPVMLSNLFSAMELPRSTLPLALELWKISKLEIYVVDRNPEGVLAGFALWALKIAYSFDDNLLDTVDKRYKKFVEHKSLENVINQRLDILANSTVSLPFHQIHIAKFPTDETVEYAKFCAEQFFSRHHPDQKPVSSNKRLLEIFGHLETPDRPRRVPEPSDKPQPRFAPEGAFPIYDRIPSASVPSYERNREPGHLHKSLEFLFSLFSHYTGLGNSQLLGGLRQVESMFFHGSRTVKSYKGYGEQEQLDDMIKQVAGVSLSDQRRRKKEEEAEKTRQRADRLDAEELNSGDDESAEEDGDEASDED